jgi:hypothetical protein
VNLFAQYVVHGHALGWSMADILIFVIVFVAIFSVAYVALSHFKFVVPSAVVTIFWICVLAFVAVVAIRFLLTL